MKIVITYAFGLLALGVSQAGFLTSLSRASAPPLSLSDPVERAESGLEGESSPQGAAIHAALVYFTRDEDGLNLPNEARLCFGPFALEGIQAGLGSSNRFFKEAGLAQSVEVQACSVFKLGDGRVRAIVVGNLQRRGDRGHGEIVATLPFSFHLLLKRRTADDARAREIPYEVEEWTRPVRF